MYFFKRSQVFKELLFSMILAIFVLFFSVDLCILFNRSRWRCKKGWIQSMESFPLEIGSCHSWWSQWYLSNILFISITLIRCVFLSLMLMHFIYPIILSAQFTFWSILFWNLVLGVFYLGATSRTIISHVYNFVGPASNFLCRSSIISPYISWSGVYEILFVIMLFADWNGIRNEIFSHKQ